MSQIASANSISPSQGIAMNLITAIVTQDEEGVKKRISSDITLTTKHNGGDPVVRHGEEEYLTVIKRMWGLAAGYPYGAFQYVNFTETEGLLNFTQMSIVKTGDTESYMLSVGSQAFSFKEGRVTAITVEETDTPLTKEVFLSTMAKVAGQKEKIPGTYIGVFSGGQGMCTVQ